MYCRFLKVGHNTSPKDEIETPGRQAGSWRQAIFNTVVTPSKNLQGNGVHDEYWIWDVWYCNVSSGRGGILFYSWFLGRDECPASTAKSLTSPMVIETSFSLLGLPNHCEHLLCISSSVNAVEISCDCWKRHHRHSTRRKIADCWNKSRLKKNPESNIILSLKL